MKLIVGYIFMLAVAIVSIISVTVTGEIFYSSFALLAAGLWMVNEGYRLRR